MVLCEDGENTPLKQKLQEVLWRQLKLALEELEGGRMLQTGILQWGRRGASHKDRQSRF